MQGGTLTQRLTSLKRPFSEKECIAIMKQILSALSFCHSRVFAHRDIKCENIMFVGPELNSPCKLIDFGFASRFAPQKGFNELLGSPLYMPPQIITGNAYNEKCDIWSLGIVLHYILTGKFPYKATNFKDLQAEISQARFTNDSFKDIKGFSDIGKSFLSKMLTFGEKERPSAQQLLSDSWIATDIQQVEMTEADKNELYSNMMKTKAF